MFNVIFDMDGTLLDTQRIVIPAWEYAGKLQGILGVGAHTVNVFGKNHNGSNEYLRKNFPEIDIEKFREDAREYLTENMVVRFKPGAERLLDFLDENNIKYGIASGTSRPSIEHHLKEVNVLDRFSVIIGGLDVKNGKPEPDIFLLAAKKMDVEPKNCFVFEDSKNGVIAGVAAGMKVFGVADVVPFDDETKEIMFQELNSLDEAIDILKEYLQGEFMKDFVYSTPTKVFFGKDKHHEVGKIIKDYGFSKIMLMYGMGSVKKSGLFDTVTKALADCGIEYVEMGGVEPNPKLDFVRDAAKVARENSVELVLAVGGGSAIDAAKYTAAAAYNNCDPWDFPTRKFVPEKSLPVGCILTIAAAGSEMSNSAVISNTENHMKRGFNSETNRCLFAICNPELTYSVSPYQTACGVVDIMAHTMERYFTVCEDTELTDSISEGLLKSVISAGKTLKENPCDYDARANMMWASSLSHNGLTAAGRENALCVHQLEHALSGEFDSVAHGAGLAVLFPAWAKYMYKYNPARFARFARNVWDVTESDDEVAALAGIEKMSEFFKSLGMPCRLSDFDIGEEAIDRLSELTTFGKSRVVKSYVDMGFEEIKDIFKICL